MMHKWRFHKIFQQNDKTNPCPSSQIVNNFWCWKIHLWIYVYSEQTYILGHIGMILLQSRVIKVGQFIVNLNFW